MSMVFLLVANLLKHFKRGRGVCMYTTQVNSAFRARWLASSVISQVLFFPKSQGLLRFYHHLAKFLLKINFRASFQRDIVFHFENIVLSNFASLLRVTLIWQPRRPSHTLKNNFIAWYYALWMVKVLENVFRGIICSFAVNNWSNLWRYWNQMFALFPAAIFVLLGGAQIWGPHSGPINFCYTFWRKTQQRKTAQTWDLARLLIYRHSIIFEILGFRHSKVLILVFDGVMVKTMHHFTSQPSRRETKNIFKLITHCRIQKHWNFITEDRQTFGVLRLVQIK